MFAFHRISPFLKIGPLKKEISSLMGEQNLSFKSRYIFRENLPPLHCINCNSAAHHCENQYGFIEKQTNIIYWVCCDLANLE